MGLEGLVGRTHTHTHTHRETREITHTHTHTRTYSTKKFIMNELLVSYLRTLRICVLILWAMEDQCVLDSYVSTKDSHTHVTKKETQETQCTNRPTDNIEKQT